MTKRTLLIVARLFFGLLTLTAIVTQLVIHIQHGFDVVNFFSYFTNLSNIFASVVLIIGAIYLLRRREPTATDDIIRGSAVASMALVGIVFGVLLRDVDLGSLLPWINVVLHYLMPVVMVVDWLLLPPKTTLTLQQTAYWLIYPLLYLIYTLVRGVVVGFYPYPFLNPATAGGYGGVVLYALAIVIAFLAVSLLLRYLGNRFPRTV